MQEGWNKLGRCGFLNGINVDAMVSRGGLSLGWIGDYKVQLRKFSASHIDVGI